MRIAYSNLVDSASSFTVLGTATGFPIVNVQEQRLSVRYRSTSASGQTIIVNLGAAQTVTTAAILGHNISASATASSILVSANSAASFTAGNVIATLTRDANAIVKFFTGASFQYWQFSIDDPLNTDGYIEIGRLWLGDYLTVSPSSLLDFTVTKRRSDLVTFGKNRQKYATPGENWRRFELSFPATGGSMLTAIQTMYDAVGNHSSVLFCNFDDLTTYSLVYPVYASIEGDISFRHDSRQRYFYSLTLEENK